MPAVMHGRRGSIFLTDLLLSILIAILLVPATVISVAVIHDSLRFNEEIQDETGLVQLRQILMISYDIHCDSNTVFFEYQGRDCRLSQVNSHLIIQPGTQIILADIDTCMFEQEGNALILHYERNGQTYRAAITSL